MQKNAIQNIWKQLLGMAVIATIIIFYIVPLYFNPLGAEVVLAMAAAFVVFNIFLFEFIYKEINKNVKGILVPLLNQNFALNAHSLVSEAKLDGTITYVNEKFVEISGYSEAELVGKKHSVLNSNNQPKAYWQDMHNTVLAGKIWHDEVRNRAKDGRYYWVDTTIVPNLNSQQKVIGFTSIRTDITSQKETLVNLAVAKEQAESAKFALDQHSLVSVADIDGSITYVNEKFVEISGYSEAELVGKKHSVLNSNNQP
ncbi:MAG: PAS domain-containing protein, partial [Paraglaciecola sp.]|nr:PAS domain-containing protein [Paraglaciecola sp.]